MPNAESPIVITVFGSSRPQPGSQAYETAQALGAALAKSGFVVANGGYGGTMEATARGARRGRENDWRNGRFSRHYRQSVDSGASASQGLAGAAI